MRRLFTRAHYAYLSSWQMPKSQDRSYMRIAYYYTHRSVIKSWILIPQLITACYQANSTTVCVPVSHTISRHYSLCACLSHQANLYYSACLAHVFHLLQCLSRTWNSFWYSMCACTEHHLNLLQFVRLSRTPSKSSYLICDQNAST